MRGLRQYKKRNAGQNESRANWNAFLATAAKIYGLKQVYREDLQTGEIVESSRSKMSAEIGYFPSAIFEPVKSRRYALVQSLIWEELEAGAVLFTATARFWIENARPVPPPPAHPTATVETSETDEFFRAGEIDLHYENIVTEASDFDRENLVTKPCGCVYELDGILNSYVEICRRHQLTDAEIAQLKAECDMEYARDKRLDSLVA